MAKPVLDVVSPARPDRTGAVFETMVAGKVLVFRPPPGSVLEAARKKPRQPPATPQTAPDDPREVAKWLVERCGFRL